MRCAKLLGVDEFLSQRHRREQPMAKHRRAKLLNSAALAAFTLLNPIPIIAAGDLARGAQIATRWCASCHVVRPEQVSASADVPTFPSIARREDLTEALLTAFLSSSPPRMPDMSLSRSEIADLVAYVRSLR